MLGLKLVSDHLESVQDDETLELVQEMSESCAVAIDTLNDMLLYEKIEGNLFSLDPEEVCLKDVVRDNFRLFRVQVHPNHVFFVTI
jgi:signal transduction histidine kinase